MGVASRQWCSRPQATKAASRKGQPIKRPMTGPAVQAVTAALIMSASGPVEVKASPTMIRLARIREGSSQAVMAA